MRCLEFESLWFRVYISHGLQSKVFGRLGFLIRILKTEGAFRLCRF